MSGRNSWRPGGRAIAAIAVAAGLLTAGSALADGSSNGNGPAAGSQRDVDSPTVPNPIVTGPIQGSIRGGAYNRSRFPLTHGYVEQEYFFQGVARAADGSTAACKSRILVRRPTDPAAFNGSVILDWDNVTVPDDTDVGWLPMHTTIMDRGFVYVAVGQHSLVLRVAPNRDSRERSQDQYQEPARPGPCAPSGR